MSDFGQFLDDQYNAQIRRAVSVLPEEPGEQKQDIEDIPRHAKVFEESMRGIKNEAEQIMAQERSRE